jgi:Flp pilus assembly protein TadD
LADYQGAIVDFSEAVRIDPENAYAYNARGSSKLTSKDIQGAKMDFQKAATLYKQQGNTEYYNYTVEEIKKLPE